MISGLSPCLLFIDIQRAAVRDAVAHPRAGSLQNQLVHLHPALPVRYRGSLLAGDIHMGILTDDMKRIVREQRLGYIATVCPDGTPNLSPKGTTAVWDDDHLVFADI